MQQQLAEIESRALAAIAAAQSAEQLTELKVAYLGKKGEITSVSRTMGQLSPEERPVLGALVNQAKDHVEEAVGAKMRELKLAEQNARLQAETIDITLPGRRFTRGNRHILRHCAGTNRRYLYRLGLQRGRGPAGGIRLLQF